MHSLCNSMDVALKVPAVQVRPVSRDVSLAGGSGGIHAVS